MKIDVEFSRINNTRIKSVFLHTSSLIPILIHLTHVNVFHLIREKIIRYIKISFCIIENIFIHLLTYKLI